MTKATGTYKEAMERLDQILENIDQSDISIDELADQVVEAAELLKRCRKILTDTEAKVKNVLEDLETEFGETEENEEES